MVEAGLDPRYDRTKAAGKRGGCQGFASHSKSWRNAKHSWQWLRSLEISVYLKIAKAGPGNHRCDGADVLLEIWTADPEAARSVRAKEEQPTLRCDVPLKISAFLLKLCEKEVMGKLALELVVATAA